MTTRPRGPTSTSARGTTVSASAPTSPPSQKKISPRSPGRGARRIGHGPRPRERGGEAEPYRRRRRGTSSSRRSPSAPAAAATWVGTGRGGRDSDGSWDCEDAKSVAEAGEKLTEARIWRLPIRRYPHRRRPRRHRGTGSCGGLRDGARGGLDGPPTPMIAARRLSPTADDGVVDRSTLGSRRSSSDSDGQGAPPPAGWGE